jgi:hypothetical protein
MWEAVAFAAGAMLFIWRPREVSPYWVAVLVAAMLASFWRHAETAVSLGLGIDAGLRAGRAWWPAWLVLIPVTLWLARNRLSGAAGHALVYLVWCVAQQLAYQKMVSDRLREGLGPGWGTRTVSGALFAMVHAPNPVLMPATFVWGIASSYLFERFPSVIALGILQFFLSTVLFLLTPLAWNHGMRVGPGDWSRR